MTGVLHHDYLKKTEKENEKQITLFAEIFNPFHFARPLFNWVQDFFLNIGFEPHHLHRKAHFTMNLAGFICRVELISLRLIWFPSVKLRDGPTSLHLQEVLHAGLRSGAAVHQHHRRGPTGKNLLSLHPSVSGTENNKVHP